MSQAPTDIKFRKQSQQLELSYASGDRFSLSSEFLRVHSPSAEVRGHGAGQETLQTGKLKVSITELIPVGNYALQLVFSDGHDSGRICANSAINKMNCGRDICKNWMRTRRAATPTSRSLNFLIKVNHAI